VSFDQWCPGAAPSIATLPGTSIAELHADVIWSPTGDQMTVFGIAEGRRKLIDLRRIAAALGGEVSGNQTIVAPGPNHSPGDRSLTVWLDPTALGGFRVHSFAGDPWQACRDHVADRIGLDRDAWRRADAPRRATERRRQAPEPEPTNYAPDPERTALALALWDQGVDPRGTLVERYLNARALTLDDDLAGRVIRWNSRIGAMVALFRNIETGKPQAVSRTYLDGAARKIERKFLGPVGGAAVMLDPFDGVTAGLHVGEGVESCQAARQFGLRPTWALGSAVAIARLQVLAGIESLTILGDHDPNGAGQHAAAECGAVWRAAGKEVHVFLRDEVGDFNDALRAFSDEP
jgi:hypothetical protein